MLAELSFFTRRCEICQFLNVSNYFLGKQLTLCMPNNTCQWGGFDKLTSSGYTLSL